MAMQLSKSILEGEDFLGFKVRGKHRILYYNLEGNQRNTAERFKNYEWKDERNAENLLVSYDLRLASSQDWEAFQRQIESLKVDFVIIDPLRRLVMPRGWDWNDNSKVADFYNRLNATIKATGVTFLLLHHTNKPVIAAVRGARTDEYKRSRASGAMALIDMAWTRLFLWGKERRRRELYYFGKSVETKTLKLKHENRIWLPRGWDSGDEDEDGDEDD
jgi:RecA-family ATPase